LEKTSKVIKSNAHLGISNAQIYDPIVYRSEQLSFHLSRSQSILGENGAWPGSQQLGTSTSQIASAKKQENWDQCSSLVIES